MNGQLIRPVGRPWIVAVADVAIDNKFRLGTDAVAELARLSPTRFTRLQPRFPPCTVAIPYLVASFFPSPGVS